VSALQGRSFLSGGEHVVHDATMPSTTHNAQHVVVMFGDRLGSSSVAVDYETAEIVERTDYLAYGQTEGDARFGRWKNNRHPYNFTGKEEDRELGLHYFGARYYSSNLGRWVSPDPLTIHGLVPDPNPYAYVRGRVSSAVDPTGLEDTDPKPGKTETTIVTIIEPGVPQAPAPNGGGGSEEAKPKKPNGITPAQWWQLVSAMNPFDTFHTADVTQHAIQAVQNGNGPEYVKQLATSGSALEIAKVDPRMRAQTPDGKNGEADGRKISLTVAMALIPAVKALGALRAAAPTTRALTAADLGLAEGAVVEGSFSVRAGKATAYIKYLGKPPAGLARGLLGIRTNLANAARAAGADTLRIETSPIIEETGRLADVLEKVGFEFRANGTAWWEAAIK
jgi:RHS repeat-associated protein